MNPEIPKNDKDTILNPTAPSRPSDDYTHNPQIAQSPDVAPQSQNVASTIAVDQNNAGTTFQQQSLNQPENKTKIMKIIKIALIAVAVFFAVVAIFIVAVSTLVNRSTADAVKVSDRLVDGIQANKVSEVYSLTSEEFKQKTSESQLSSLINSISPDLQGEEKIIARKIETVDNSTFASIVYEVSESGGSKKYIRVILSNSGTWKVINFRASELPLEAVIE